MMSRLSAGSNALRENVMVSSMEGLCFIQFQSTRP
jgi:hypothetical protein